MEVAIKPSFDEIWEGRVKKAGQQLFMGYHVECFAEVYLQKHSPVCRFLLVESICDLLVEFIKGRDCGVVGSEAVLVRGDGEVFC